MPTNIRFKLIRNRSQHRHVKEGHVSLSIDPAKGEDYWIITAKHPEINLPDDKRRIKGKGFQEASDQFFSLIQSISKHKDEEYLRVLSKARGTFVRPGFRPKSKEASQFKLRKEHEGQRKYFEQAALQWQEHLAVNGWPPPQSTKLCWQ